MVSPDSGRTMSWNLTRVNVSMSAAAGNASEPDGALHEDHQMGLVVLFSLTTFLAIVGNFFVVLVFARGRRSRTDLRPFLINLAVADLLMAVFCMPFTFIYTMLQTWIFSRPMCPVVLFVQVVSVLGSVFTNTAIGIDRFLVVAFPLRRRLTKQNARCVIVGIWIVSFAISSVQFKVAHTIEIEGGTVICEEGWPSLAARKAYTVCIFTFTYCIPLAVLSITYTIVGVLLWKRTMPGNRDQARDLQQLRSKRKSQRGRGDNPTSVNHYMV